MLDMSWGEVMLIGGVALIVIGPKDLPKAMRVVGHWFGRARGVATVPDGKHHVTTVDLVNGQYARVTAIQPGFRISPTTH